MIEITHGVHKTFIVTRPFPYEKVESGNFAAAWIPAATLAIIEHLS